VSKLTFRHVEKFSLRGCTKRHFLDRTTRNVCDSGPAATAAHLVHCRADQLARVRNTGPAECVCYLTQAVESAIAIRANEIACALDQEGLTKCCNLHHRTPQRSEP
jgi:hypothetical protein